MAPITIRKEIQINAPVETVWKLVGTPDGMRRWWETDIDFEAKEGGRCQEQFASGGQRHSLTGTVTRYDPPREIGFAFQSTDRNEEVPSHSQVSIQLEKADDGTRVKVAHRIEGALVDAFTADAAVPVMTLRTGGSPMMGIQPQYEVQRLSTGVIHWQFGHDSEEEMEWKRRLATLRSLLTELVLQA